MLYVLAYQWRLFPLATTGFDPLDPAHRYTLHTAVLGARVLGWPHAAGDIAQTAQ